jgi:hypothetical protein
VIRLEIEAVDPAHNVTVEAEFDMSGPLARDRAIDVLNLLGDALFDVIARIEEAA